MRRSSSQQDPIVSFYGTAWPFYPEAAALAKVLIMTEHDKGLGRQILRDNAAALLGI